MSAALQVPPTARVPSGAGFFPVCVLVLLAALAVPYVAIMLAGGGLVRTVYPAYILCVALFVMANRRPLYPAFMIAVFAFSPFLRRVADYQAGFAIFNLILLGPYTGLLPTVPALLRRAFGGRGTLNWPFAVVLICVIYAVFLAMFRMAFIAAAFEGMKWLLPTALAAFIMAEPAESETVRHSVIQALCLIMPILTLYGVYQFLYAPLWDVYWMWNIDNPTFGFGEAFKIRVFSMMNSPGTVGMFSSYAMTLLAGDSLLALAIAAASLPLLALTLIRTAWLSIAAGLAVLLLRASGSRRLILIAGMAGIGFIAAAIMASPNLPPDINNMVTERLATFAGLSTDNSADDRLAVYDAFFGRLADSPWGEGFGANISTISLQGAKRDLVAIDSGLLEAYLIYGIVGGTLYFLAFGALVAEAWRALPGLGGRLDANFAVVGCAVAVLPLGSNEVGEPGVLVWTALGTLFAGAEYARRGGRRRRQRLGHPDLRADQVGLSAP
jgi:O-antigen ligase